MAGPLDELNAKISELRIDLSFVSLAVRLRPRIGDILQWQARGEVLDLAKQFIAAKTSRPEGVYGPLLVRLLAALERYLRMLVAYVVEQQTLGLRNFDDVSEHLVARNRVLTGRLLAALDAPREHLVLDVDSLIRNLASCSRGSPSFRLNSVAFSAVITGIGPPVIDKALENVEVHDCWDGIGGNATMASLLGTKGPRATGDRARERLKELWRLRNQLAHGGDEEIALSESQLQEAIEFVACFSAALDDAVRKHFKNH